MDGPPPTLQSCLARLYTDAATRDRFLAEPEAEAQSYGLSERDRLALLAMDRAGLVLAARSFARKAELHARSKPAAPPPHLHPLQRWLRRWRNG